MTFTRPDIVVDAFTLAENAKATMEDKLPGWSAESDPTISALIEAFADPAAEQAQALELELIEAYKGIGALHGIHPLAATPAQALVTFTLLSAAPAGGLTIPLGTLVGVRDPDLDLQGFRLIADLTVAEGTSSATGAAEATVPGAAANNLTGAGVLINTPPAVISASVATSGGGEDEEEEASYLDRLTEDLELFKIGVVRAADAAGVARKVPGIGRATAVDLLKPAAADGGEGVEATNEERCVTVAVTNDEGNPATTGAKAAVLAELVAGAIANMRFFVVNAHYEKIDVTTTVFAWPGQEPAQVKLEVEAALSRLLDPQTAQTGPSGNPARWANDPVIRQAEIFATLGNVPSVRWASAATFGKHGGALSAADYTLAPSSKVPALPEVGTLNVTVEPTS